MCVFIIKETMDTLIWYIGIVWAILLLLMINRQIIGASLYNVFWPVIMAGLLYSNILPDLNIWLLLFSSYLSRELTRIAIKRVYASQILKTILYVWFTLLIFLIIHYQGYTLGFLSDISFLNNDNFIGLVGYIILFSWTMGKNYSYGKGEISKNRLLYNGWFFALSFLIVFALQSSFLLKSFSGSIFALVLLTLAIFWVGIYDGLQIKEMIRFRKLIWSNRTTSKYNKK